MLLQDCFFIQRNYTALYNRMAVLFIAKKYSYPDEVIVQQLGDAVILVPMESMWQTFMDGLNSFTDDIFEDGRDQGLQQERENL